MTFKRPGGPVESIILERQLLKPTAEKEVGGTEGCSFAAVLPLNMGTETHTQFTDALTDESRYRTKSRIVSSPAGPREMPTFYGYLDDKYPQTLSYLKEVGQTMADVVLKELGLDNLESDGKRSFFVFSELSSVVPQKVAKSIISSLQNDRFKLYAQERFGMGGFGNICKKFVEVNDSALRENLLDQLRAEASTNSSTENYPQMLQELLEGLAYYDVYHLFGMEQIVSSLNQNETDTALKEALNNIESMHAMGTRFDNIIIQSAEPEIQEILDRLEEGKRKGRFNLLNMPQKYSKDYDILVQAILAGKAEVNFIEIKTHYTDAEFSEPEELAIEMGHQSMALGHAIRNHKKTKFASENQDRGISPFLNAIMLSTLRKKENVHFRVCEVAVPLLEPLPIKDEARKAPLWRLVEDPPELDFREHIRLTEIKPDQLIRAGMTSTLQGVQKARDKNQAHEV